MHKVHLSEICVQITQSQASVVSCADHFKTIQHVNKHEIVLHNLHACMHTYIHTYIHTYMHAYKPWDELNKVISWVISTCKHIM